MQKKHQDFFWNSLLQCEDFKLTRDKPIKIKRLKDFELISEFHVAQTQSPRARVYLFAFPLTRGPWHKFFDTHSHLNL